MTVTGVRDKALLEPLAWPIYLAGALMIVFSLIDLATSIWPLQFAEVHWRYGAWGLLSGFTLTPFLGVIIVAVAGAILGHGGVLKALWWLTLVAVITLAAGSALFVLDVLQLRGTVPRGELSRFDTGAAKALLKHLSMIVVLSWLGRSCRAAAREARVARARQGRPEVLVESTSR